MLLVWVGVEFEARVHTVLPDPTFVHEQRSLLSNPQLTVQVMVLGLGLGLGLGLELGLGLGLEGSAKYSPAPQQTAQPA